MHDNILAGIAALKVIMSVSSSKRLNVSQLVCHFNSYSRSVANPIIAFIHSSRVRNSCVNLRSLFLAAIAAL